MDLRKQQQIDFLHHKKAVETISTIAKNKYSVHHVTKDDTHLLYESVGLDLVFKNCEETFGVSIAHKFPDQYKRIGIDRYKYDAYKVIAKKQNWKHLHIVQIGSKCKGIKNIEACDLDIQNNLIFFSQYLNILDNDPNQKIEKGLIYSGLIGCGANYLYDEKYIIDICYWPLESFEKLEIQNKGKLNE